MSEENYVTKIRMGMLVERRKIRERKTKGEI